MENKENGNNSFINTKALLIEIKHIYVFITEIKKNVTYSENIVNKSTEAQCETKYLFYM